VPIVFFLNSYFGLAIAALQRITPNRMRAQVSAVMLFMTNLFGLALGPSAVAAITDFVLLLCPPAALLLGWGLRYYRRALAHVDASAETGV
jgi:hypothetical protein